MVPDVMPKSLLVVGSGAIGIEFASFYRTMGAEVTVVEVMSQVMPVEDAEIAQHAQKRFEKQGIKILLEAKVTALAKGANDVTATVEMKDGSKREIKVDRVISAVGVVGNIENLGLEALGVKTDRGCVVTDGLGRTNVPGLYAIGDVAGPPMLAQGRARGRADDRGDRRQARPRHGQAEDPGLHLLPPAGGVGGLDRSEGKEAGYEVKVGRFPFIGNGKAIALGEPEGLVKTVFDAKTGQLLGAHMVGCRGDRADPGFVVAMQLETTEEDLMHTVFPHPTLSEMMHESVLSAYGRAIHI